MTRRVLTSTALATVFFAWAGAGHATNIVVNQQTEGFVDNQLCGLREAVEALNTQTPTLPANGNDCPAGNGSNDTITINPGTYPDFTQLNLNRNVTIAGAGMTSTIIRLGGVFGFMPAEGTTVTIRDLSLVKHPSQSLGVQGILLNSNNGSTLSLLRVRMADFNNYAVMNFDTTSILNATGCLFENNSGSVSISGSVNIFQSAFIGNQGSGLEFYGLSGSVDTSTFSGNQGSYGGGILSVVPDGGRLDILNTTIASNSASVAGGGLYEANAFFADPTYLNGVILANNTAPNGPDVDTGENIISEYTFIKNATNYRGVLTFNVQFNVDAMLGALVEVTTPVRTKFHPLLVGSPAIDFGTGMPASVDQRGFLRPVDGNGTGGAQSDPGAFEFDPRAQAEKLLKAAQSTGDPHAVANDAVYEGGQFTRFEANANNDFVVYAIPIARTGNHSLGVRIRKGSNRGIYTLSVSNSATGPWTAVGGQQDFYNAMLGATPVNVTFGTVNFGTTGTKYFRLQAVNKNGASSGRWLYLDGITTSD
jgi:hypothetical protein